MSPFLLSLLIAASGTSAPAAAPAAPAFQGLFVDWSHASRQSIAAERQGAELRRAVPSAPAEGQAAGSRALGERVGEVVSVGDCSEGERMARAAGDFALVAAVRDYCTASDGPAASATAAR